MARVDASEWDARYASADGVWSREPNAALVARCPPAPPDGRALDLGCGEGADARWLASRGWEVTGVDWSRVAVERARRLAGDLPEPRPRYVVADATDPAVLAELSPTGTFDLVTVGFLHPEPDQRARSYAHLADLVGGGGHLLVLTHDPEHAALGRGGPAGYRLMSPDEVLAALALPADFEVLTATTLRRTDAEGEVVGVDAVVLVRRADG
jgi:SAM-dependent methyltransferase